MFNYLLVFLGSGLGGMMRYGTSVASGVWLGTNFPYGTLIVNIVGSGVLGLIIGLFALTDLGSQEARLFLATGVMGGFTTFSAFSLDTVTLWERGQHMAAIGYVLASVLVAVMALYSVMWLMRR